MVESEIFGCLVGAENDLLLDLAEIWKHVKALKWSRFLNEWFNDFYQKEGYFKILLDLF